MERKSGVLLPLFSLGGEYSCGALGEEAYRLIDLLAESGFSLWQTLPMGLSDEWGSPYRSPSSFGINPYYIDLPTLLKEGLISRRELEEARERTHSRCEYSRLRRERLPLLFRAAERCQSKEEVEAYVSARPPLDECCRFMALKAQNNGRPWWRFSTLTPDRKTLFAWRFIQYTAMRQWEALHAYAKGRGVSLIGDLPMYASLDSGDVFFHRREFLLDEQGRPCALSGVPPDYFSKDGQCWGNPLYDWRYAEKNRYAFFTSRLAFALSLFDGVRIDHFRAIEAYFAIPAGGSPREGRWHRGPRRALLRALSPITKGKLMIAEDLGEITPAVRALVDFSGFFSTRVLQFAFLGEDADNPHLPYNYSERCAAYTGTHDNQTLRGFLSSAKAGESERLLAFCNHRGSRSDGSLSAIKTLLGSSASLAILPLQDLLGIGDRGRINTPGTTGRNWAYRLPKGALSRLDPQKWRALNHLYGRTRK